MYKSGFFMKVLDVLRNSIMVVFYPDSAIRWVTGEEDLSYLQMFVFTEVYAIIALFLHHIFVHQTLPLYHSFLNAVLMFPAFWLWSSTLMHFFGVFVFRKKGDFRRTLLGSFYASIFYPLMPFFDFIPHFVLGWDWGILKYNNWLLFGCVHFSQLIMIFLIFRMFNAGFKIIYDIKNGLWRVYLVSLLPFFFAKVVFLNIPIQLGLYSIVRVNILRGLILVFGLLITFLVEKHNFNHSI